MNSPKAKTKPSADVGSSSAKAGGTPVKGRPNPYHNLELATQSTSVEIESVSAQSEKNVLAEPVPKRGQQYRALQAALKKGEKNE